MKRCLIAVLAVSLLLMPGSGWTSGPGAQQDTSPPPATSGPAQTAVQPYPPEATSGHSRASRRSYARETRRHHHHHITKDGVHGYVSAPKYTEAQIAASGAATGADSAPAGSRGGNGLSASEGSSPTQATLSQRPPQP